MSERENLPQLCAMQTSPQLQADRELLRKIVDEGYWPTNIEWLDWLKAHQ